MTASPLPSAAMVAASLPRVARLLLLVPLAWAVIAAGCASTGSFVAAELAPLTKRRPVSDTVVAAAVAAAPQDATWVLLEQSFALLRHADTDDDIGRARRHLEAAFATFEDLRDPENFNVAFTADAATPYRGRPHERVLAATALALTDAAHGRCDLALPTLRAAEFLDVRWQKLAFGTDAAVVYALARWCLEQTDGRPEDKRRAEDGLRLTLRLGAAAEPGRALIHEMLPALPRPDAVAARLAGELMEVALLTTLANDPRARSADEILMAALGSTTQWMSRVDDMLALLELEAALDAARAIAGGSMGNDRQAARRFVRNHLKPAIDDLALALRRTPSDAGAYGAFVDALAAGERTAQTSLAQLSARRVVFTFTGTGPMVTREGQYQEVARVVPRDGAPGARGPVVPVEASKGTCGIRGHGSGFVATLCGARGIETSAGPIEALPVWSSSVQATSVVGRRFDTILKGRAAFKAGAEGVAQVAGWTAWSLWEAGLELLDSCDDPPPPPPKKPRNEKPRDEKPDRRRERTRAGSECVTMALTTLTAGAAVAGVGGVAWLAGAAVNPAADPRFVDALPETVSLLVPRHVDNRQQPTPEEPR